jgi:hypothetical protein
MRWMLFLVLPLLCFSTWSCNEVGKTVAGGPGDPSLFDQVPANPSVPVINGAFSVQMGTIATTPVGNPPTRYDRYGALRDTTTILITNGPSSNTILVAGAYLDPRINDQLYLSDRGNNTWIGRSGIGSPTPFTVTVTTDGTGSLVQYIVQMISTGTDGKTIATRRTYDRVPNAIIQDPGLKYCRVRAAGPNPTPTGGDFFNMICNSLGLAQWEQDTFEQKFRFNPLIGINEAQFTTYDTSKNPPNIEHYDTIWLPIPPPGFGTNSEFNHNSGALEETVDFSPPPAGGWILPLDCSGKWHGIVQAPNGVFQNTPYILRDGQSDVVMTVDSPNLLVTVNARCVWDSINHIVTKDGVINVFNVIRLEGNPQLLSKPNGGRMIAVRQIAVNTYDILTLDRGVDSSSPLLTPHTQTTDKSLTVERFSNGTLLGSYSLGNVSASFPLEWWP